jgi:hypothetical protein
MALGSTEPLTEKSTGNLSGGKGRPEHKADNFAAICEPTVQKMSELRRLIALWTPTACYSDSFTFVVRWFCKYCIKYSRTQNLTNALGSIA